MNMTGFDVGIRPAEAFASNFGASVDVEGVEKRFGDHRVLRGIDIHIPAGQFVAIVGRSGCGKSTLLRLIAGLDRVSGGRIAVAGAPIRLMFQEPRLLPWQRVRANVEVGLAAGMPARERAALAQAALARVGLGDRGGVWPSVLSGGQKQRVALARALVSGPRLLALDEPLGALDALTRIEMQELIESVWQTQGFTAIVVTHDVSEAVALADRILVLEEGRVVEDIPVPLPRSRERGDSEAAAIEGRILRRLLARA